MEEIELTTVEVRGTEYAVTVTPRGQFRADLGNGTFADAWKLEDLAPQIAAKTRRQQARIEFKAVHLVEEQDAIALEDVVFTGTHATNHALLYRDGRGQAQRCERHNLEAVFFKPMTKDQKTEAARLMAFVRAAEIMRDDYMTQFRYGVNSAPRLRDLIETECQKAAGALKVAEVK